MRARLVNAVFVVLSVFASGTFALPDSVQGFTDFTISCPSLLLAQTPIKLRFLLTGYLSQTVNFTVNLSDSSGAKCVDPFSQPRCGRFADDDFLIVDPGSTLGESTINALAHGEGFTSLTKSCNVFVVPGWCCVIPFFVTVCVAIYSKNVLVAMFIGLYIGALLLSHYNPLAAFLRIGDTFMFLALKNANLGMLLFTFFMSGMIGVVNKSDGFRAVAVRLNVLVRSSRGAQLATLFAGLIIFFDDYSNTLIIGPSLLPVTDAARVSREKLAFIVDSTSASITSMVLLRLFTPPDETLSVCTPHFLCSTWIGFELSIMGKELALANIQEEAISVFVRSLPLRYYTILLVVFCTANILMLRDFGPMLVAEQRARQAVNKVYAAETTQDSDPSVHDSTAPNTDDAASPQHPSALQHVNTDLSIASAAAKASPPDPALWYFAAVPIFVMTVTMGFGIFFDGRSKILEQDPDRSTGLMDILSATDTSKVLIWSTLLASVSAIALCVSLKRLCLEDSVEAWIEGIRVVVPGLLILIFSWSMGEMSSHIHVGAFLTSFLGSSIPQSIFPALVFVIGAMISLATGSSWGTMSILFPMVVPVAAHMGGLAQGHPNPIAPDVVVSSIAAILSGSIFGDHCSPISDTTVFAAITSSCDLMSHVKTQLPYAITIAFVSLLCSLFTGLFGLRMSPIFILVGSVVCCLIIRFGGTELENYQFDNRGRVREVKSLKVRMTDCWNSVRSFKVRRQLPDDSEMSLVPEHAN